MNIIVIDKLHSAADEGIFEKLEFIGKDTLAEEYLSAKQLKAIVNIEHAIVLVAYDGKETIGYIYSSYVPTAQTADLMTLIVTGNYQSQGIGTQLLQQLLIALQKQNICEVLLEVRSSNQKATTFYEKNMFFCVGVRRNYYKRPLNDGYIYRKEIKLAF